MRFLLVTLFLLMSACGNPQGVPIQVNLDTEEEHAVADRWIKELNRMAGCEWIFGPGKVWFDHRIEMKMSTALVDKANEVDAEKNIVGYWDGMSIVMMDKEQRDGRPLDTEALIFIHELGHALGLQHSPFPTSFMYKNVSPVLSPSDAAWQLVQALGGPYSNWSICDQVNAKLAEVPIK